MGKKSQIPTSHLCCKCKTLFNCERRILTSNWGGTIPKKPMCCCSRMGGKFWYCNPCAKACNLPY